MKKKLFSISLAMAFATPIVHVHAASLEKALLLNQHGLTQHAKAELIEILFSKSDDASKAQAYYILGSIAFEEKKISVALDSWRNLVKKYPNSSQAKQVKDRIAELAQIVGDAANERIDNAIAASYISHGDFWSRGKQEVMSIDSSWIDNLEAAVKWYDKVIAEFPKSAASRVAYEKKLHALLGWEESGRYGTKYGLKDSYGMYVGKVLDTFESFEKEHPTASTLQAFRYQIAQVYWSNKEWRSARIWLNRIIENASENDSFYKDLAERRLKKMEY